MTDQVQTLAAATASSPTSVSVPTPAATATQTQTKPQPQRSPLDILEEILDEKEKTSNTPASANTPSTASDEQKLAEVEAMEAEQEAEDKLDLVTKQAELETAKQTPAYQARVEQEETERQRASDKATAQAGFEIKQLGHIKLEEDSLELP